MRKLMWFSIGFAAAVLVGAYVIMGSLSAVLGIGLGLVAVGCAFLVRNNKAMRIPAVVALGCCAGFLWFWGYDHFYLQPVRQLDGVTTQAVIEVIDFSFDNDRGIAADGKAVWNGQKYRLRLYLHEDHVLKPGDLVSGTFDFRITDKGGSREPTFHRGNGIALLVYQDGPVSIQKGNAHWSRYPIAHLRHEMLALITELFPADTEGFARALLLGDDSDLSYARNTAFKITGVRHIVAVSGLHVSILFGLIYLLTARKRQLTTLLGVPLVVLFAGLAGFTPSVVRASVMHILLVLASLFDREYDAPTAMGLAAILILGTEPLAATSVGFQLSFACVGGILLFYGPIRGYLLHDKRLGRFKKKPYIGGMIRGLSASLAVSAGVLPLTVPLCAFYFGTVSLISPLTNLLTLWMVTFVFYGIMAACAIGALFSGVGQVIAWIVSWGIRYLEAVCDLLAKIPLAAIYQHTVGIVLWLILAYLLLALAALFRKIKPMMVGSLAIISLCVLLLVNWIVPTFDECRVTVLDVGQGQSVILQSKGRVFVVDCGGTYGDDAADMAAERLHSMGIYRIDGLILTHYDSDHAGGVLQLLSRVHADRLYFPECEQDDSIGQELLDLDGVMKVDRDMILEYDTAKITLITSQRVDSGNERSVCILFQTENCDILITGDRGMEGEQELMDRLELPKLEVLIAGHHGSKNATGQPLLDATQPQVVVISAGKNNAYGHPAQELLLRLEGMGCTVFRTDLDGTVIIRR